MAKDRREYKREYFKKYYQEHKEYYLEYKRKHAEANRIHAALGMINVRERKKQMVLDFNIKYLKKHKKFFDGEFHCPKCGKVMMVTQVHNHHIKPEDKLFNISEGIKYSYEKLANELPKTIPICPECHKIITANERGHRMFKKYNSIPSSDLNVMFSSKVPHFVRKLKH